MRNSIRTPGDEFRLTQLLKRATLCVNAGIMALAIVSTLPMTAEAKASATDEKAPPASASPAESTLTAAATVATPPPAPTPSQSEIKKISAKLNPELKKHCDRHFPGLIQGDLRTACGSVAEDYPRFGKSGALVNCRLNYGEEPREVMACLIGVEIADEMVNSRDEFKKRLQLCAEQYPAHTEIDAFLQESCLTGIHLPDLLNQKPNLGLCSQISPERSFLGPCSVGLSLALRPPASASNLSLQNRLCEQYFDHKQFHTGYRSCLTGRSIALAPSENVDEILKTCTSVISNNDNDTERAACFVGASIYRKLPQQDDLVKRFQKCGETKVSYEDRNVLACLAAASLVELDGKNGASSGCKEIFKTTKSRGRSDCLNSISQF